MLQSDEMLLVQGPHFEQQGSVIGLGKPWLTGQMPTFVNRVLLRYSHAQLFTYNRLMTQKPKIFTIYLFIEKVC